MNRHRRGHGEGTISQYGDGRWCGRLDLGYVNGRRKRKAYYGATRKEVQDKLNRAIRDYQDGRPIVSELTTVSQHLDEWLEAIRPSLRQGSYAQYDLNVRRAKPIIGRVRLAHLSAADLQMLYSHLLQEGSYGRPLSRRSVEQCHTVLHKAFKQAVRWGRMVANPSDNVEVPRPQHREMRTLDQNQVELLLTSTSEHRLAALWELLVTTGLRLGEALGLQWSDFDAKAATLQVRRALQHKRGTSELVVMEPKTKTSRRLIHLTPHAVSTLRDHRKRQNEERLKAAEWEDRGFIFTTETGAPVAPRNIGYYLTQALRKAGLPQVRVHDLRHTAATLLLQWGTHPKVVQEMLGHSTIAITLDLYSHVIPAMHREAAQQFGRLFQRPSEALEASS